MFETIVGHEKEKAFFENKIKNKNISHAYCFEGQEGIGKKSFGLELAKHLLCGDNKLLQRHFDSNSHGDFCLISPDEGSIKTEQVTEILDFLSTAPSFSKHKIVLIDEADKMNLIAQNKMLKIIEEPPKYALFLIISSKYNSLIDTLKSRLVRIPFSALDEDDLKIYCDKKNIKYNIEAVNESEGSVLRYLNLLDSNEDSPEKLVKIMIKAIMSKDGLKIFNILELILSRKEDFSLMLNVVEKLYSYSDGVFKPESTYILGLVSEIRYRLNRNQQLDLLIIMFFNRLQEVFDDKCCRS